MESREQLYEVISGAGDLRSVARTLGRFCLLRQGDLMVRPGHWPLAQLSRSAVATAVEGVDEMAVPLDAPDYGARLEAWLRASCHDLLAVLDGYPGFAAHGVLRGLCGRPLRRWFELATTQVEVRFGDPIPIVEHLFGDTHDLTPSLEALLRGDVLGEELCHLFDVNPPDPMDTTVGPRLEVILDFEAGSLVDEAIWDDSDEKKQKFHCFSTIHPHGARAIDPRRVYVDEANGWWFGVWPDPWNADDVERALVAAKNAGAAVVVLPEMSLPRPDALRRLIERRFPAFPRLIVAGSAHEPRKEFEDAAERSNRTVVYLDGSPLFEHRKVWPFFTDQVGSSPPLDRYLPEGINSPLRLVVASGSTTRVAVAICSDLHDPDLPRVLRKLCVNVLLVPALTPGAGMFQGVAAGIAGANQGVALLANGSVPGADSGVFLVLLAVPREGAGRQVADWVAPDGLRKVVTLIDPNVDADEAILSYDTLDDPKL